MWSFCRMIWNMPPSEAIACVSWLHWYLHLGEIVCQFRLIAYVTLVVGAIYCMVNLVFIKVDLWVNPALIIARAYQPHCTSLVHTMDNPRFPQAFWTVFHWEIQSKAALFDILHLLLFSPQDLPCYPNVSTGVCFWCPKLLTTQNGR